MDTKAAVTLRSRAERTGWQCSIDTVEGTFRELPIKSTILRMAKGQQRLVGQWLNDKAATAYEWTAVPGRKVDPTKARIGFKRLSAAVK